MHFLIGVNKWVRHAGITSLPRSTENGTKTRPLACDAYGNLVLSDERHNAPGLKIIKSRWKKKGKKFLATHRRILTAAATCSNGNKLSSTTKNKVSVCARRPQVGRLWGGEFRKDDCAVFTILERGDACIEVNSSLLPAEVLEKKITIPVLQVMELSH